jgi:hypothetical protein
MASRHCCAKAEELLLPPRDHSSNSSSLSSFSCTQDTSSDEKEFTGSIIDGADASLLLRVSRGSISLARDDDKAECIGMLISNIRDTTNDDSDIVLLSPQ